MPCSVKVTVGEIQPVKVSVYSPVVPLGVPYTGPYEFTPSGTEQIVEVGGTMPSQNITINPIPSNYGLVTWTGSYLLIS